MSAHEPLDAGDVLLGPNDDVWHRPDTGLDPALYETEGATGVTADDAVVNGMWRAASGTFAKTRDAKSGGVSTAALTALDDGSKATAADAVMPLMDVPEEQREDPMLVDEPTADPDVIATDDVCEPRPVRESAADAVAPVSPPRQPVPAVVCVLPPEKLRKLADKCLAKMLAGPKEKDSSLRLAVRCAGGYSDDDPGAESVDHLHRASVVALSAVKMSGGDLDLGALPAVIVIKVPGASGKTARAWTRKDDPTGRVHLKIHTEHGKAFSRLEAMLLFGGYAFFRCRYADRAANDL